MLSLFRKSWKDTNDRRLKPYWKLVEQINALETTMEALSDQELQAKTITFKEKLQNGQTIDDIKVEAFAVVREAAKRIHGMRHYDVQLIGGLVLTEGNIAEMATGEGKTLVASLPSYLRALEGKGVHVITVNDYLARRDCEKIGQIHQFLGLTVGLNVPQMEPEEKKAAYTADITYGVGTEFGFDYLRDNMIGDLSQRIQRPYHFAIIDEVDSVLIDEAKTPLIIAGKMNASISLHRIAAGVAKRFKVEVDYTFDPETKATSLTDEGIEKVERAFGIDNLYDLEHQTLYHYMIQAVRAHVIFERDVDYIVKDGKIALVDMFTGRIMEGRSLSDGLHQAIEAKEGLELTEENKTQASITIQNYFRMYPNLSGMTGTARTEEKEFRQIYGMLAIQIPTNKPKIREDMGDKVFKTTHDKYTAVAKEVKERHAKGQPVLIGTTSILQSEKVAEYLENAKIPFTLLNAKNVEQEVELISKAGQKGMVTIATNMAGRGTDILLGDKVYELGGLHVLGTERHESRRIDDQLKGRAGRQGDPGSSQFFISLEDDMFRRFASEELEKLVPSVKTTEEGIVLNNKINDFADRIQRIVEGFNFSMREYNLKLDDVINEQRNVVYQLRNNLLEGKNSVELVIPMIQHAVQEELDAHCSEEVNPDSWPLKELEEQINQVIAFPKCTLPESVDERYQIEQTIQEALDAYIEAIQPYKEDESVQSSLRQTMLIFLDHAWTRHLEDMTRLKEGIGLRQYQQEDPIRLYQNEALAIFTMMYKQYEKSVSLQCAGLVEHILVEK
ncbi:accessory Sec system translocase SecA2 [Priestia koreensis]|uniref:Protein translocase subunit SecA n=1 Tax=Priestia koreensis TaxID=284581 RepID=A0A0M0KFM2_9BACI|nr:accessory Sec system translocase SecA2 [Priestia koreensis]KOO37213.1 preprotein translocase subunit SecA [Priestia koreensis]